ncbi:hypothetical protein [Phytoactinopolyspora halotolerans]|uniref:Uncharacterized protein n=1 Tax=Phytoactinopolyspora halotolerans TaxID=1981512 RepID=A0A6L9SDD2_9ACTN|nr:hypothetical protein [Phytoactinopolyspora halotolerans]NEE02030.1 hypothetical protein [Phytoactinopolyspora halotolerans]
MTDQEDRVYLWRQPDGYWRWQYALSGQDGVGDTRLLSHTAFASREEARAAAGTAYPDVSIDDLTARRRRRWLTFGCMLSALGALGALAVVAVAARRHHHSAQPTAARQRGSTAVRQYGVRCARMTAHNLG